jgi:hypothetical protein
MGEDESLGEGEMSGIWDLREVKPKTKSKKQKTSS